MLTPREVFDRVRAGLLSQSGPSASPYTPMCRYRQRVGSEERKCAAGWMIPDEHYSPIIEGIGIGSFSTLCGEQRGSGEQQLELALTAGGVDLWDGRSLDLLRRLQSCHDALARSYSPSSGTDAARWRADVTRVFDSIESELFP